MDKVSLEKLYPGITNHISDDFDRVLIREEDFPPNHLTCRAKSTGKYYFRYLVSYGILEIYITKI